MVLKKTGGKTDWLNIVFICSCCKDQWSTIKAGKLPKDNYKEEDIVNIKGCQAKIQLIADKKKEITDEIKRRYEEDPKEMCSKVCQEIDSAFIQCRDDLQKIAQDQQCREERHKAYMKGGKHRQALLHVGLSVGSLNQFTDDETEYAMVKLRKLALPTDVKRDDYCLLVLLPYLLEEVVKRRGISDREGANAIPMEESGEERIINDSLPDNSGDDDDEIPLSAVLKKKKPQKGRKRRALVYNFSDDDETDVAELIGKNKKVAPSDSESSLPKPKPIRRKKPQLQVEPNRALALANMMRSVEQFNQLQNATCKTQGNSQSSGDTTPSTDETSEKIRVIQQQMQTTISRLNSLENDVSRQKEEIGIIREQTNSINSKNDCILAALARIEEKQTVTPVIEVPQEPVLEIPTEAEERNLMLDLTSALATVNSGGYLDLVNDCPPPPPPPSEPAQQPQRTFWTDMPTGYPMALLPATEEEKAIIGLKAIPHSLKSEITGIQDDIKAARTLINAMMTKRELSSTTPSGKSTDATKIIIGKTSCIGIRHDLMFDYLIINRGMKRTQVNAVLSTRNREVYRLLQRQKLATGINN
ncbi:unnamed protein product [Owenia fusiformis]|uniref:Uncharacterized protein n=1 Tax=Owenia fusiformis TaxID=6347 RepID=A0A8J1UPG5_OWEFU|nr:unnamed protein product [Owenia fusiformis]